MQRPLTIALVVDSLSNFSNGTAAGYAVITGGKARNPQQASRISIGLQLAPANLDIRTQSGSALDQLLIGNVYEGLVARTSTNTVVPSLAKSWEVSSDGMAYVFHLNTDMHFSNGHRLDADDVVWSIRQMMDKKYQGYSLVHN